MPSEGVTSARRRHRRRVAFRVGAVLLLVTGVGLGLFAWREFQRARTPWKRGCLGHLSGLGVELRMFAEGNGGLLPQTIRSYDVITYGEDVECALARGFLDRHRSRSGSLPPVPDFEYVGAGLDLGKLPPGFPLAFDKRGNHPDGTRSVLCADTTVWCLTEPDFQALLWKAIKEGGGEDPRLPCARLLAYVREGESRGGHTPDTRR